MVLIPALKIHDRTEKLGKDAMRKRASAVHFMRDVEEGNAGGGGDGACSGYSDEELVEAADKIEGLSEAEKPVSLGSVAAATAGASDGQAAAASSTVTPIDTDEL